MTACEPLTLWAISDGRSGMENQALGLAEAIARLTPSQITVKRIAVGAVTSRLPRMFWGKRPIGKLLPSSDSLSPPYPDIWIACGRRTIPFTISVKGRGPFTVQTQDPKTALGAFDLVVPPQHDGVIGGNVISMVGSPNRLTADRLRDDAAALANQLPDLPRPYAAFLIGGGSRHFKMTETAVDALIATAREIAVSGRGLLITASRRTPTDAVSRIRAALTGPRGWMWDGQRVGDMENPYFGILGLAERIFVTEESANMLTDAAFTGKPVRLLRLEGGAPKWTRFHESLVQRGVLKPDAALLEEWDYAAIRETDRVAAEILSRYRDWAAMQKRLP